MKTFEEWVMWIGGGLVTIGAVVTGRVVKVQDEHAKQLAEHAEELAAHRVSVQHNKASLERIESKLDRVIEREHGA